MMRPTKALGINGFPAIFYQKCWHIMGKEVSLFCLKALNKGLRLDDFNSIVLIPKVLHPTKMINFRVIILCNVIYKIIAKSIRNRFQRVLDRCVDKAQGAFVLGRLISDNILLAYELLHTFSQKKKC